MRTLTALLVIGLIWVSGLLAFADRISRLTPAPLPQAAEGVVVLTGAGSNARLDTGMAVLEAGLAKRLLVSGVNREASREGLAYRELNPSDIRRHFEDIGLEGDIADHTKIGMLSGGQK
ncbi:MAG: hypothetical protein ACOYKF_10665, partial [Phenylobacterium sp.]